jgi:hypothetical protein
MYITTGQRAEAAAMAKHFPLIDLKDLLED